MTSREVFQMGELSIQWIAVNVYYQFIDFYRGKITDQIVSQDSWRSESHSDQNWEEIPNMSFTMALKAMYYEISNLFPKVRRRQEVIRLIWDKDLIFRAFPS